MTHREPSVSKDLVDRMEQLFPDRLPDTKTPDRDIWVAVGAAKVVRKLRQIYEQQTRNALGAPHV